MGYLSTEMLISSINRTAKASIALCIARLIPKFHFTHKASIVVACLSALIGLGIEIQTCVYCTKVDKTWTHVPPYRCKVATGAGIVRLGCEFILIYFFIFIFQFSIFFSVDLVFFFFSWSSI